MLVTNVTIAEETPVGPYAQPEWTLTRRFTTTRVFVQQPPGGMSVEQWVRTRYKDGEAKHLVQEEFAFGLPGRLQVDLYYNWDVDGEGQVQHDNVAVELRHALADWGKLPLNPAVYGEYKLVDDGGDVVEAKLLLCEELAQRWHWGLNAVWEREMSLGQAEEWAANQSVSYTVLDRRLGVGIEMKYVWETGKDSRGDPEKKLLIGPSLQWRPTDSMHIDIAPLFGLTDDAPDVEAYLILGKDFGPGFEKARAPVSLRSN
jgi:hypothetical protein